MEMLVNGFYKENKYNSLSLSVAYNTMDNTQHLLDKEQDGYGI